MRSSSSAISCSISSVDGSFNESLTQILRGPRCRKQGMSLPPGRAATPSLRPSWSREAAREKELRGDQTSSRSRVPLGGREIRPLAFDPPPRGGGHSTSDGWCVAFRLGAQVLLVLIDQRLMAGLEHEHLERDVGVAV